MPQSPLSFSRLPRMPPRGSSLQFGPRTASFGWVMSSRWPALWLRVTISPVSVKPVIQIRRP
ncbi:hypothetical protein ACIBKY_32920 [Nonomuraea sp. NPDC050394]|uniref:hypothetical protein n=1 Tax=Nonomuraea sp. NPDC050394 TaxID=3364363 RepID=UPI0037B9B02E